MAPAWLSLSVPRTLSLDRVPSSSLRHEHATRHVVPSVLRPWTTTVVVSASAQKRLVAVAAGTKMDPATKTFIEEMRTVAIRLHSKDQYRFGEKEVPLEPPVDMWEPTVEGFIRFLVDSKLVFETIEAIVDRAAIPWCE